VEDIGNAPILTACNVLLLLLLERFDTFEKKKSGVCVRFTTAKTEQLKRSIFQKAESVFHNDPGRFALDRLYCSTSGP
jgi:hypothetical protein